MKLHAFGDSFVVGDQDEKDDKNKEYLKYNVSFVSIIAKHFGIELVNYSESGSGNFSQLDKLFLNLKYGTIQKNDVVLFGMTSTSRDRTDVIRHYPNSSFRISALSVDNPDIFNLLMEMDEFYILSILENLGRLHDVKIIKFNAFTRPFTTTKLSTKLFTNYLNDGNLMDILDDTWGVNVNHLESHGDMVVMNQYKHLYTPHKHPSVIGHEKIARWFIDNVDII
jgi:hypothetical protein